MSKFRNIVHNLFNSTSETSYKTVYYRPKKGRLIAWFIGSLIFMIMILVFSFGNYTNRMFLIMFISDLVILIYCSINLFGKGIYFKKQIEVNKENKDEHRD